MFPLPRAINQRLGRAMHRYRMLDADDRILVAVSGGIDSLVLLWLLDQWRAKTPFDFRLLAVHVDMGFDDGATARAVGSALSCLPVPYLIKPAGAGPEEIDGCAACARLRRKRLFDLARTFRCNKIAFGHHGDDMIETLLLNMCYAGNLSTLLPRQELFDGRLAIIRPLAGLHKEDVEELGRLAGLRAVKNPCPFGDDSRRSRLRRLLADLYRADPPVRHNMLAALANVRPNYLPSTPG